MIQYTNTFILHMIEKCIIELLNMRMFYSLNSSGYIFLRKVLFSGHRVLRCSILDVFNYIGFEKPKLCSNSFVQFLSLPLTDMGHIAPLFHQSG